MKKQEIIKQINILNKSVSELNKLWMEGDNPETNDLLTEYYPFETCFNELSHDINRWANNVTKKLNIKQRLEELRTELRNECISYGELSELMSLSEYIDDNDVELLQASGVSVV